jgi:hypothetical protein
MPFVSSPELYRLVGFISCHHAVLRAQLLAKIPFSSKRNCPVAGSASAGCHLLWLLALFRVIFACI